MLIRRGMPERTYRTRLWLKITLGIVCLVVVWAVATHLASRQHGEITVEEVENFIPGVEPVSTPRSAS
jgi:hypothetical protein